MFYVVIVEIIKVSRDNSKASAHVFEAMHTKEMLCRKNVYAVIKKDHFLVSN